LKTGKPTISTQIKNLEESLEQNPFDRKNRYLALIEAGKKENFWMASSLRKSQHPIAMSLYDNAVVEGFFHTFKIECVHYKIYQTRKEESPDLFEYIEIFYNRKRLHSYLGYRNPVTFKEL
jgi:hypothetical protein